MGSIEREWREKLYSTITIWVSEPAREERERGRGRTNIFAHVALRHCQRNLYVISYEWVVVILISGRTDMMREALHAREVGQRESKRVRSPPRDPP